MEKYTNPETDKKEIIISTCTFIACLSFVSFIILYFSWPDLFRTAPKYCYIEENALKIHYAFGEDSIIVKDSQFDQMVKIAQEYNCNLKVIH